LFKDWFLTSCRVSVLVASGALFSLLTTSFVCASEASPQTTTAGAPQAESIAQAASPSPSPASSASPDEATPAPATTPAGRPGGPSPATGPGGAAPSRNITLRRHRFRRLIFEPTLVQTENVGSDTKLCFNALSAPGCTQPKTAVFPGDLLRIAGNFRYYFTPHIDVHVQRIEHTGIAGRTYTSTGAPTYGGSGEDYEMLYSAEYTFTPDVVANVGWDYRARVCCPGAGDPTNPTPRAMQAPFISAGWRFGPQTRIGRPLSATLRVDFVNHHFDAAAQASLPHGQTDSGRKATYTPTIYYNIPVYGQRKFVPYVGYEHYGTYFDNSAAIGLTNRTVFGAAFHLTDKFTLSAQVKNDINYPNIGNGTHKAWAQIIAGYRFEY